MTDIPRRLYDQVRASHGAAYGDVGAVRIARAPGRVNIIGEHTDYNGLPVLPTAIDREIAIAFASQDSSTIRLVNITSDYGERTFIASGSIEPFRAGDWGNYAKAAVQALWGWAEEHAPDSLPLKGFAGSVGGTIPAGSGLSSSSAMVVAVAVAMIETNSLPIEPEALASLLAAGEQYVGTQGGGMDQAASILSKPGCALRIDFAPLRSVAVPVPDGCVFVIANSLVRAEKAGAAKLAYNTRVAECRLGVRMLRRLALQKNPEAEHAELLGDIMRVAPEWRYLVDAIPPGALSLDLISDYTGIAANRLRDDCLRARDGSHLQIDTFEIKKRCKHVLTEAERVGQAEIALRAGDIAQLGRLMDASHESCASDYDISCPELDDLVATLRRHGALGARLTGAGFGGCAVAVAERSGVESLVQGVWRDYHEERVSGGGFPPKPSKDDVVFACAPSAGAGLASDRV